MPETFTEPQPNGTSPDSIRQRHHSEIARNFLNRGTFLDLTTMETTGSTPVEFHAAVPKRPDFNRFGNGDIFPKKTVETPASSSLESLEPQGMDEGSRRLKGKLAMLDSVEGQFNHFGDSKFLPQWLDERDKPFKEGLYKSDLVDPGLAWDRLTKDQQRAYADEKKEQQRARKENEEKHKHERIIV